MVVGGGPVGTRKAEGLIEAGARVTVVSPEGTPTLEALDVTWHRRTFVPDDLDGAKLAFAATDSEEVNAAVVAAAAERGVWVNDATSRERSDFVVPSTLRRGSLSVAVSTGGGSPAYAKLMRELLAETVGEEHAQMLALLAETRPRVRSRYADGAARRAFWDELVTMETLNLIRNGRIEQVRERIEQCLSSS